MEAIVSRRIFEVSPDGSNWKVVDRLGRIATKYFEPRTAAIEYGQQLAQQNQPSRLVIRRREGTIDREQTYG
jgi:hypothetical protein